MSQDFGERPRVLRIDGGMARNNWMAQFLSDITQIPVERPALLETTALGAARLAGLGAGLYDSTNALNDLWHPESNMLPTINKATRDALVAEWNQAVTATIQYANASA